MPDYGVRPPAYLSGALPAGIFGKAPYGWSGTPRLNDANTPYNDYFPAGQFVYERMDWEKFKNQVKNLGPGNSGGGAIAGFWSNPPFMGAGQMVGPNGAPSWMRGPDGGVQRILRGYMRRQSVNPSQPESFVRLYFMYNPDQVQRQYLSWNDSTTLDAAGTTGQESDNSQSAIPSVTTLTFTLYFDRQIEVATITDHPGVMVDLQAFDVLSGNLVYKQTEQGAGDVAVLPQGMALPDNTDTSENHSGQIQPTVGNAQTFTTVVFSPSLAVEGILSGANATFTKFSPRMTPTTLALTVTLAVVYAGKNNNQVLAGDLGAGALANPVFYDPLLPGFVPPATQEDRNAKTKAGAAQAVLWAQANLMDTRNRDGTPKDGHYDGPLREHGPPYQKQVTTAPGDTWTDCSSFVFRSFYVIGWGGIDQQDLLHLGGYAGDSASSWGFMDAMRKYNQDTAGANRRWYVIKALSSRDALGTTGNTPDATNHGPGTAINYFKLLRPGDVLARNSNYAGHDKGHVAFFLGTTGDITTGNWDKKIINLLMSSGTPTKDEHGDTFSLGGNVAPTAMSYIWTNYEVMARPEPWGPTTDGLTVDADGKVV